MIKHKLSLIPTKEFNGDRVKIPVKTEFTYKHAGLYNYAVPLREFKNVSKDSKKEDFHFDSLLDVNPVINIYGLQVQKVTRKIIGKKVIFVETHKSPHTKYFDLYKYRK